MKISQAMRAGHKLIPEQGIENYFDYDYDNKCVCACAVGMAIAGVTGFKAGKHSAHEPNALETMDCLLPDLTSFDPKFEKAMLKRYPKLRDHPKIAERLGECEIRQIVYVLNDDIGLTVEEIAGILEEFGY